MSSTAPACPMPALLWSTSMPPLGVEDRGGERVDRIGVGHVEGVRGGLATRGRDLARHALGRLGVDVADVEAGTELTEEQGGQPFRFQSRPP